MGVLEGILTTLAILFRNVMYPILDMSVGRKDILAFARNFQMAPDATARWLRLWLFSQQGKQQVRQQTHQAIELLSVCLDNMDQVGNQGD